MKMLNSVDFGTEPLGAPLVAGDLSGSFQSLFQPVSLAHTL